MKKYRVIIHYEGAVAFNVKADNEAKAEQLAEELFDKMSDSELIAGLCEIGACDCYEVDEKGNRVKL